TDLLTKRIGLRERLSMRSLSTRRHLVSLHGEARPMNIVGKEQAEMQAEAATSAPDSAALPLRRFSISSHVIPGVMVGLDSLVILSTALISYYTIVGGYLEDNGYYGAAIAFFWLVTMMLMNFAGLYRFEPIFRPLAFADKIAVTFATTILFLLAAAFSLKISTEFSRVWIGSFTVGAFAATMLLRVVASRIIQHLADMRVFSRNVVIVGAGEQTSKLLDHIEKSRPRFISVLGLFSASVRGATDTVSRYPALGKLDDIAAYVRSNDVDDIIISLPWSADDEITRMVTKLRELPVNVYLGADLIGFRLPLRPPPD